VNLPYKYIFATAAAVLSFGLAMIMLAIILNSEASSMLFSEQGVFERMSPVVWCLSALYLLWKWRDHTAKYFIYALTFFIFAGREYDIHKAFTSDSFLKINFYKNGIGPEQIFGGMAALTVISLIVSTILIMTRDVVLRKGYVFLSGQLFIAGFSVLALSKILDRTPSVLRKDYDILLSVKFDLMLQALEEGFEFFGPLLILLAFVIEFSTKKMKANGLA